MLIYAISKAFPRKTFVVSAKQKHTIARVRAQLLHILYDLGREDHQFRLRFNGQYLKDSLTLDDYDIMDNAVFKMIPMAKEHDSLLDIKSAISDSSENTEGSGALNEISSVLVKEVRVLNRRQFFTAFYHGLLSLQFIGAMCSIVSSYWYSFFYHMLAYILSAYFAPSFSRLAGFTGNYTISPKNYCILFSILMLLIAGASTILSTLKWMAIVDHGCKDWIFVDECSQHNVYTAIFFGIHAIVYLFTFVLLLVLLKNYGFQQGDYIEQMLVQTRDLYKILKSAKSGKIKERRIAAFELASMAVTSDDNKFLIVAENGLDALISLSLTDDLATQEYSAEALAELLTIPEIQNKFVEIDGVKHLSALLHSQSNQCVYEAVTGLSYIVQENQDNQLSVTAGQGLNDLCKAAYKNNIASQRVLAGIFLDLVFTKEIRDQMASMNSPAQALIHLCQLDDLETQKISLQSLELLALESPETICAQLELLPTLLAIPHQTTDTKVLTLAAKLLLYFSESVETCEKVLTEPYLYDSLMLFARTSNSTVQKVVVKIIYSMTEHPNNRIQALSSNLDQILLQIKHNAADRDIWNMADAGIQMMQSADNLSHLPVLSTADKVSLMHGRSSSNLSPQGSNISIRSRNGNTEIKNDEEISQKE